MMKIELNQSQTENFQSGEKDPIIGSNSVYAAGGQEGLMAMVEKDPDSSVDVVARGCSDECMNFKVGSNVEENHCQPDLAEEKSEAGGDERNLSALEPQSLLDSVIPHPPRQSSRLRRQRQPRQLYGNSKIVSMGSSGGGSSSVRNGSDGMELYDNPSYALLKRLQAELLDALLEKEDALLELKILREKLKTSENLVKELTKKLKKLDPSQQTQPTSNRKSIESCGKKKQVILSVRKKAKLKEKKEMKESKKKVVSRLSGKKDNTNNDGIILGVPVVRVENCMPSVERDVSPLSIGTCLEDDDVNATADEDKTRIGLFGGVENWDHEDIKTVLSEEHKDEDFQPPRLETSTGTEVRSTDDVDVSSRHEDSRHSKRVRHESMPKDNESAVIGRVCHMCSTVCDNWARLKEHTLAAHPGVRPFKCEFCDKTYWRRSQIVVHTRIHSGEKPYVCNICGKGFTASSILYVHRRIHLGNRTFECPVCSKIFLQKGNLDIHMRVHTGIRPYKCSVCSKEFKQQGNLIQHNRIHTGETPYQCTICGKLFSSSSQLHRHTRGHMDLKRFQCPKCPKRFNEGSHLNRHLTTHSEERPHACHVCGQTFRRKYHVTQHMRRHNKDNKR